MRNEKLLYAAIAVLVAASFTFETIADGRVSKINGDEITGDIDLVTDVDLSGIGEGTDTNEVRRIVDASFEGGTQEVNRVTGAFDGVAAYTGVLESQKRNKRDLSVGWTWATDDTNCPSALVTALNRADAPIPNLVMNGATGEWGLGEVTTNGVFGWINFVATKSPDATDIRFGFTDERDGLTPKYFATATRVTSLATIADVAAATNGIRSVDGAARPLPKYLHALDFDDSYPNEAAWYYNQPQDYGSCSAVRDGNALYRNYDWKFDEAAEFVIRMAHSDFDTCIGSVRFASVGVANCGTNLTEDIVTSGKWSRYYKCLPGHTVDGVNENGVVCEVNVVDGTPPASTGGDIHPMGAVRWALDNGTSAGMAASNLALRIAFPSGWTQNFHWMVADASETWIVENGAAHLVSGKAVMTNFRLYPRDTTGAGQERYDLLAGGAAITNVWYTRAYLRTTNWASDFKSAAEMESAKVAWETHEREELRGKGLWQTVHTSIYDITNRVLRVAVQEQGDFYTFAVPSAGGVKPEVVREIVQPLIEDATNGLLRVETDPTVPAWAKSATPPFVPYEGAECDVNLGNHYIAAAAHRIYGTVDQWAGDKDNQHTDFLLGGFETYTGSAARRILFPWFARILGNVSPDEVMATLADIPAVPSWALQPNPPEGMTPNALVLTNGAVKTKSGTAVTPAHIGAVGVGDNVVVEWEEYGYSSGAEIGRLSNEWGGFYGGIRLWSGWNWRSEMFYDHIDYYHGDRGDGTPYKTTMRFPENGYDVDGRIAMETWYSLSRALADANTNTNADCECICTNLCNLISPKILLKSEPHLAYINGELHIIKITEVEE